MGRANVRAEIGLGFRAARGGGLVVAVALNDGAPRLILSTFIAVGADGDRLALEPYHVAAEMAHDPEQEDGVAAAVAEGLDRQRRTAAEGLARLKTKLLDDGPLPVIGALLVNRAGWVTDILSYSLEWPDHIPVAEGLAVRDAFRYAMEATALDPVEMDEKSLPEAAAKDLGLNADEIEACLKALGAGVKPWRKEQKLACLAAWVALARR